MLRHPGGEDNGDVAVPLLLDEVQDDLLFLRRFQFQLVPPDEFGPGLVDMSIPALVSPGAMGVMKTRRCAFRFAP